MQSLKLVNEDTGVQNLRQTNRMPVTAGSVAAVPAYPSTHAARIGDARERMPAIDRRVKERRRGEDRRKKQVPVLLDTRASHDRRMTARRSPDDEDNTVTRSGINQDA